MVRPSCAPLLDGIGWNTTPRGLYYRRRSPNSLQSPRGTLGPGPNGAFPRYGEWFRLIDGCLKSLMSDSLDKIESELLGSAQERLSGEGGVVPSVPTFSGQTSELIFSVSQFSSVNRSALFGMTLSLSASLAAVTK